MSKLTSLKDGLVDQIKDLYSAEHQLVKALPKMEKRATNEKLKAAFSAHLTETEEQVRRLEEIGKILQVKLSGKTCKAMQGLIEEGKEAMEEDSDNDALIDSLLIGAAQRVEHYEMAAYGTARAMARELSQNDVVKLLEQTLNEEKEADKKLSAISEGGVLSEANTSEEEMDETDQDTKKSSSKLYKPRKGDNAARLFGLLSCLFLCHQVTSLALADTESSRTGSLAAKNEREASQYNTDNTGRNMRDRNASQVTADDQSLTGRDLEVVARIRREIVANDSLSTNAHNVKIIVENGQVMLRGPVKSLGEKAWIGEATSRIAANYKVVNELEVAVG